MLERLLFVSVLIFAAVMSFIMCSDAARASPTTTRVKPEALRRLYGPHGQHRPLSASLLSSETGLQTGTNGETETSGNCREATSIIDHQSNPERFTEGSFVYNQNIPDNGQFRAAMTRVQSGASSVPTSRGGQSFERRKSSVSYHPPSQKTAQSGKSYNSYPAVIRDSSHQEAARPFHRGASHVWDPRDAQKSYDKEKVLGKDSPDVVEDKTAWQPSSLFSSQTARYRSTSPPLSRRHYGGYKETNGLPAAGAQSASRGSQSSTFLSFASQTAPHAPSVSKGLDASVIKSNPSPEKLTSSITDFSQSLHSVSSSETPRPRAALSYLFKELQTSSGGRETAETVTGDGLKTSPSTPHERRPSDARVSSHFKQSQREEPTTEVQNPSHSANVAQYGPQIRSFTKNQRNPPKAPAPGTDKSFAPKPGAHFQGDYGTSSKKSVSHRLINTTTRGPMHAYKPEQTIKKTSGFRGFQTPAWKAAKKPSTFSSSGSNERANSRRFRFDKGYRSVSAKYSFSRREAFPSERASPKYSSPPLGTSDIVHTMMSTRQFTPGFKGNGPLLPVSDVGVDSKPDRRRFSVSRRTYGLKGFGTRPLEGAKPLVSEPDKSAKAQQGFGGLKLSSWQPKSSRIHRWYNETGETEPGSSHVSTMSQNEVSSKQLETLSKTPESIESDTRFTSMKYKKSRKIFTFHPVQNESGNANNKTQLKNKDPEPTTASASSLSSAFVTSAESLTVESSPTSEPNTTKALEMKVSLLHSSTSSTVRGKRVKGKRKKLNESTSPTGNAGHLAIVRLPKRPARLKAVTYTDVLGSASFSGVRAAGQIPISPADKAYFQNTTAADKQKAAAAQRPLEPEEAAHGRIHTSKGVEAHEGEDSSHSEGNRRDKPNMKTSDLPPDDEGSGSGGANMADTTKSEDLLGLDYLRLSTGNVSFKSMKLSRTEK